MEEYDHIRKDMNESKNNLQKQITGIELKQQEIQSYISTIDNSINQIEHLIHREQNSAQPNNERLKAYRHAVTRNVELITQLYNSYKEFENVKFRYHKEISDNSYRLHRLVELELKKIEDQSGKISQDFFNVMRSLSTMNDNKNNNFFQEVQKGLSENEYEL